MEYINYYKIYRNAIFLKLFRENLCFNYTEIDLLLNM